MVLIKKQKMMKTKEGLVEYLNSVELEKIAGE
jgi:hypothetical protein